jgi:hypothetical protein
MPSSPSARPVWLRPLAALLVLFGLLTLKEGGGVLIGDPAARAAAGAYVPFVVWFNTLSALAYVAAGVALWRGKRWAGAAALAIAAAIVVVYAAFAVHVAAGGAYEMRTVWAMALRSAVWIGTAALVCRRFGCRVARGGPP